jgi:small subunit ribosomal protein S6
MRSYELVVLLHPDLEIDVDTPIAKIEKLVTSAAGTVTKRDNWGKKRLAYPIKKQQFGIYVYFELELPPTAVRELESQLLITEEVIRFLIVSKLVLQRPGKAPVKSTSIKPARPAAAVKE